MSSDSTVKEPAKHHLVPKFYLRHFADDGTIRVLSKKRWKAHLNSVDKASCRTHFYSRSLPDGRRSYAMESWMSQIEGSAGSVFNKLNAGEPPTPDERTILSVFIALQIARSNEWRTVLDDVLLGLRDKLLAIEQPDPLSKTAVQELAKGIHIDSIVGSVVDFARVLLTRSFWMLMVFKSPQLLTSDAPIVILPLGTGLQSAGCVTFPIGHSGALMLLNERGPDFVVTGDSTIARNINLHVASQAEDLVFMHPDTDYGLTLPPLNWQYEQQAAR